MPPENGPTRREELLAVATKLFAARGYHGTRMDDVADAVAMQQPSVFTLQARGGAAAKLRAFVLTMAASNLGRPAMDLGLIAPRETLMSAARPRVRRLASPLHDRRGPRRPS